MWGTAKGRLTKLTGALLAVSVLLCAARAGAWTWPWASQPEPVVLRVEYGSEKSFMPEVVDQFNRKSVRTETGKLIRVEAKPAGSLESVDNVLDADLSGEDQRPHVLIPASSANLTLGNHRSRQKAGGQDLIYLDPQPTAYTPTVIATWEPTARALGYPDRPVGWGDVLALATNRDGLATRLVGEDRIRFAHTHPELSNSGLTGLLGMAYAALKADGRDLLDVGDLRTKEALNVPAVNRFIQEISRSVVHYGTSTGFFETAMYRRGPQYLHAAVVYESSVANMNRRIRDERLPHGRVVALYPEEGTFLNDNPFGIVKRDYVTPELLEAANAFKSHLVSVEAQTQVAAHGFRPANPKVPVEAGVLSAENGVDVAAVQVGFTAPPGPVIEELIALWRANKKPARVILVFDVSGSMDENQRLTNAKLGAKEFLRQMTAADRVVLVPFSSITSPPIELSFRTANERQAAEVAVDALQAKGGTALYSTVRFARREAERAAKAEPAVIHSVVVLTDGDDSGHGALAAPLPTVEQEIDLAAAVARKRPIIPFFTIAYEAPERARSDLKAIAERSGGRAYQGVSNELAARRLFREISTLF